MADPYRLRSADRPFVPQQTTFLPRESSSRGISTDLPLGICIRCPRLRCRDAFHLRVRNAFLHPGISLFCAEIPFRATSGRVPGTVFSDTASVGRCRQFCSCCRLQRIWRALCPLSDHCCSGWNWTLSATLSVGETASGPLFGSSCYAPDSAVVLMKKPSPCRETVSVS